MKSILLRRIGASYYVGGNWSWFIALGWALHVLWDLILHPGGYPGWYPGVCLGFDIAVGLYLARLLISQKKQLS